MKCIVLGYIETYGGSLWVCWMTCVEVQKMGECCGNDCNSRKNQNWRMGTNSIGR